MVVLILLAMNPDVRFPCSVKVPAFTVLNSLVDKDNINERGEKHERKIR